MKATARTLFIAVLVIALVGCGGHESSGNREDGPARVQRFDVASKSLDRRVDGWAVVPPAPKGRALLVLLHPKGGSGRTWVKAPVPDLITGLGDRAPVVVSVTSSDHSYWHDRRDGQWASLILDDVIPAAVDRFGVDPDRVGIAGMSMGGYGALRIAQIEPERFCVVGAHEPAIWTEPGLTAPGAFDDAEDFARNDVIALVRVDAPYPSHVWIDRGRQDDFIAGQDAFAATLRKRTHRSLEIHEYDGPHSMDVVRRHLEPAFEYYAERLEKPCRGQI